MQPADNGDGSAALVWFSVAGFEKAGSTTLYDLVAAHPGVARAVQKELRITDVPCDAQVESRCGPGGEVGAMTGTLCCLCPTIVGGGGGGGPPPPPRPATPSPASSPHVPRV
jgi:hypothetical protein